MTDLAELSAAPDPHTLIGGSRTLPQEVPHASICRSLDAYCATVFHHPDVLLNDLFELMQYAELQPTIVDGGKIKFYARNQVLIDETGHRLLSVKSGGSNPHPHVECKGLASPIVAAHLRANYDHRPTRIDDAKDLRAPRLFDLVHRRLRRIAKRFNLRLSYDGDWSTPDAGRTIYLGARTSQVFVRVYEKGLKYARDLGLPVTDELRNWVRFELEFHPQTKTAKTSASTLTPEQLWGSTRWTTELAGELLSMRTEPISIRERRESNVDRALRFMASQYRGPLGALLEACDGDYAAFGQAIAELAGIDHPIH